MAIGLGELGTRDIYSPAFVRRVFRRLCDDFGAEEVTKNPRHKKNREMWVGATFALGMMAMEQSPVYIAPGDRNQSPDVYAVRIQPPDERGGQQRRVTNLEVTEFGPTSNDDSPATFLLRTKLAKNYTGDIAVVCYCAKPSMTMSIHEEYDKIKGHSKSSTFPETWLISSVESEKGTHLITRLWPQSGAGLFFTPEKIEETVGADMGEIIASSFGLGWEFKRIGEKAVLGWFE